jgi:hypothetical protein
MSTVHWICLYYKEYIPILKGTPNSEQLASQAFNEFRQMAKAVKKDKPKRERTPARQRYETLEQWLRFTRGQACELPHVPLRLTSITSVNDTPTSPVGISHDLRKWTENYLRNVARATAEGLAGNTATPPEIERPPIPAAPARTYVMPDGSRVTVEGFSIERSIVDSLTDLITSSADLTRLRICPACDSLFVAYNKTSYSCPPPKRCGQKLRSQRWYQAHHVQAQNQALARYYEAREAGAQQQRKKRRTKNR